MKSPKPKLKIDWATHAAAKFACENWHYSKKTPVNKLTKFGVWENDKFIGAIIFSCGSAGCSAYSKSLGIQNTEIAELARVALNSHKTEVTRILSIAVKKLKAFSPGLRIIVSYADREQGHHGGIYQGGNWYYIGLSSKDVAFIDSDGNRHHSRNVSESGFKVHCGVSTKCKKPSEMRRINIPPKHKYLMPLDADMKKQIEPLRKPYPKRVPSKDSVASDLRSEEGGANPTGALQNTSSNTLTNEKITQSG